MAALTAGMCGNCGSLKGIGVLPHPLGLSTQWLLLQGELQYLQSSFPLP